MFCQSSRSQARSRFRGILAGLLGGLCLLALGGRLHADLIKLKNGGELRGRVEDGRQQSGDEGPTTIRTLSGTQIVVEPAEIEFITRRPLKVERYETLARATPDTVEDQWELAEWCRKNRLTTQRDTHLQRVVELDPDHEQAHRALGHMQQDGEWTSRDEIMQAQGYVRHKGRYVSAQELEIIQRNESDRKAESAWHKKIRLWYGWLDRPNRQAQGEARLRAVKHPDAVRGLEHFFAEEEDPARRSMYVEILSQIPGDKPVEPLVRQSLQDPESRLRRAALDGISADQVDAAYQHYLEALSDKANVVLQRAATALGEIGNLQAVPHLIDALVTTHKYRVRVADDSSTITFGKDGSFRIGGQPVALPPAIAIGLRTGQFPDGVIVLPSQTPRRTRVVTVRREHENSEVRAALNKLTGQRFGYNQRDWALWWAAQKQAGLPLPAAP